MNENELRRRRKRRKERVMYTVAVVILAAACLVLALIAVALVLEVFPSKNKKSASNESASETYGTSSQETADEEDSDSAGDEDESYTVVLDSEENEDESVIIYGETGGKRTDRNITVETIEVYDDSVPRLWLGDSRTVGMEMYTSHADNDTFIAEVGMAYDWFEGYAVPQMEAQLDADTEAKVYVLMGVNDCAAAYSGSGTNPALKYAALINTLMGEYPLAEFYFVSVGPGVGDYYGSVNIAEMNNYIDSFNAVMEERCGAFYIDAAEYLKETGFESTDGIHYTAETYQRMYDYVLEKSCYTAEDEE